MFSKSFSVFNPYSKSFSLIQGICPLSILLKLPKDTYFIADLIGLKVYTDEGNLLGTLEDIYNSGASDIYVVKDELGKQILLPAIKDVIKQIDLEEEKIIVHLIKGLV